MTHYLCNSAKCNYFSQATLIREGKRLIRRDEESHFACFEPDSINPCAFNPRKTMGTAKIPRWGRACNFGGPQNKVQLAVRCNGQGRGETKSSKDAEITGNGGGRMVQTTRHTRTFAMSSAIAPNNNSSSNTAIVDENEEPCSALHSYLGRNN